MRGDKRVDFAAKMRGPNNDIVVGFQANFQQLVFTSQIAHIQTIDLTP
jgi:hypothetical protein